MLLLLLTKDRGSENKCRSHKWMDGKVAKGGGESDWGNCKQNAMQSISWQ